MPIMKDAHIDDDGQVIRKEFSLANTDAFVAPACVVPDIGGPPNRYYYVEARSRWDEVFVEWLASKKRTTRRSLALTIRLLPARMRGATARRGIENEVQWPNNEQNRSLATTYRREQR